MRLPALILALALAPLAGLAQETGPERVRIEFADFRKAVAGGDVFVIDVRGESAYASGHIPGAVSIPESRLASHLEELRSQKKPIVTYCG